MQDNQSFLDLQVDEQTSLQLTETSRWAKFLGIAVLTAVGLMILMVGLFWSRMDPLFTQFDDADAGSVRIMKVALIFAMLIIVILCVILMTFLIKGANSIRNGIRQKDQVLITTGLGHFKNYLAMMGVLGLIGFLFSLIGFFSR